MDYKSPNGSSNVFYPNGSNNVSYITPQQMNMPNDYPVVIPEPAEEGTFVYDAFISYRHCDPDQFVAEKLHKLLETFKVPTSVLKKQKKEGKTVKKKIKRVFRDQEELPLATNLEDPIIEALMNSEWLIVICSLRLKESLWCKKEIETFIKYRGREHVLAVLVEGEPYESFPEELLRQDVKVMNPDGSIGFVTRNVEPLAADVRGASNKDKLNRLDSEMFRILAPMLGLGYDELRQRHRERRVHKIISIVAVVAVICFLFGVLGVGSALIILGQKGEIEAKTQEIATQNELLIMDQAKNLANEAIDLYEKDDRIGGIEFAYKSLTESDGIAMPYTDDGRYALVKTLNPYDITDAKTARYQIETRGIIDFMMASPSRSVVVIHDSSNVLTLWSFAENKEIDTIELGTYSFIEQNVIFKDDNTLIYGIDTNIYQYDISTKETTTIYETDQYSPVDRIRYDSSSDILYFIAKGDITGLDKNNKKCFSYNSVDDEISSNKFKHLSDGYVVVNSSYTSPDQSILDSTAIVRVLDKDANVVFSKEFEKETYENSFLSGDQFFVLTSSSEGENDLLLNTISHLRAYDFASGQLQWEREDMNIYADRLTEIKESDGYNLIETGKHGSIEMDKQTGEESLIAYEESEILWMGATESSLIYVTDSPIEMYLSYHTTMGYRDGIDCKLSDIKLIAPAVDGYVMVTENSNHAVYYTVADIDNFEEYTGTLAENETVGYSIIGDEEKIAEYDLPDPTLISYVAFDKKEDFACISYKDGTAAIYDMDEEKVVSTFDLIYPYELVNEYLGTDGEGNTYWASQQSGYCISVNNQLIGAYAMLRGVDQDENKLIFGSAYDDIRYAIPNYSVDELLEMAAKIIE